MANSTSDSRIIDHHLSSDVSRTVHLETLISWQLEYDRKIDRLVFLLLAASLFYIYYGFLSPLIMRDRLESFEAARRELEDITVDFERLRERYSLLVLPTQIAPLDITNEIRVFDQNVLAELEKRSALPNTDISEEDRDAIRLLRESTATLSDLYRVHYREHPPLRDVISDMPDDIMREQLMNFRKALGVLVAPSDRERSPLLQLEQDSRATWALYEILAGRSSHTSMEDDPVNNLEHLAKLETVASNLKAIEKSPANWSLCEIARAAINERIKRGEISQQEAPRLGDTLTQTFKPHRILAEYTRLSGNHGRYRRIEEILGAPFQSRTVLDLHRLRQHADQLIDKTASEASSPALEVPLIDATIDRLTVLGALPIMLVLLLHIMSTYINRRNLIAQKIESQSPREQYLRLAPRSFYFILPHKTPLSHPREAYRSARSDWTYFIRSMIASLLGLGIFALPFTALVTLLLAIHLRTDLSLLVTGGLLALGFISFIFMFSEVLYIARSTRSTRATISAKGAE
jgi:hypothetical protein